MKTWYILGAGAIGGLWALRLHRAGLPVQVLRAGSTGGLRTLTLEDGTVRWQASIQQQSRPLAEPVIQRLLVCTKAQDTLDAVHDWRSSLAPKACIVLLQNGMGVREALLADSPDLRIFNAITTEGVYRRSRDELVLAGAGSTLLGSFDDALTPLCRALAQELIQAGLPIRFSADIRRQLWRKLVVNCAINPLSVLFSCPNGELLDKQRALHLMQEVCREMAPLMQAEGFAADTDSLFSMVRDVARATAANTSSMLADVRGGRTTEIAFMNGFVVARGATLGLPCPTNQALFESVRERHR
jgi:2-dehydropantoate 2-reductase